MNTILSNNGNSPVAYTSPDERTRVEVDLYDLDIFHNTELQTDEIPVYDRDGYKIKRTRVVIDTNQDPPALLADLKRIHRLYQSVDEDSLFTPKVFGYSQAFTGLGNYQADGPPPMLQTRLTKLNRELATHPNRDPPIVATTFQGYNRASHRTRYSARTHEAQTGAFTQILSGTHCRTAPGQSKFDKVRMLLDDGAMPFDSLRGRIQDSDDDVASYFRLEAVYSIEMLGLDVGNRNSGRSVKSPP
jgi:hypothetical protein